MRRILFALAMLSMSATAAAQTPNPVMQHYRAYNAALEAGDLQGAETAAAAALTASEQRDGDGGNTAVLAANLAQVRLDLGRPADALAPARRAFALAQARGADSNVDPALAQLLLGRAELSQSGDVGQRRLQPALEAARANGGLEAESYDAASALGAWAIAERRYNVAESAYRFAVSASGGDNEGQILARADAHVGLGLALLMVDDARRRGQTGSRLRDRPNTEPGEAFNEALRLALPVAARDAALSPTGPTSRAQAVAGTALAWRDAFWARARGLGWSDTMPLNQLSGFNVDLNAGDNLPACSGSFSSQIARPDYPANAIGSLGVGGVAIRVVANDANEITDLRIVGVAGGIEFANAIREVYERWPLQSVDGAGAACSAARVIFTPFYFTVIGG